MCFAVLYAVLLQYFLQHQILDKKSVQDFINRHREKIQEEGRGKSAREVVNYLTL